jgi:hypothetical protein
MHQILTEFAAPNARRSIAEFLGCPGSRGEHFKKRAQPQQLPQVCSSAVDMQRTKQQQIGSNNKREQQIAMLRAN